MSNRYGPLLLELRALVRDEQEAARRALLHIWGDPLPLKLERGLSQGFLRLERADDPSTLWAYPDDTESRFREGDQIVLHEGDAMNEQLGRGMSFELEEDDRWLLRGPQVHTILKAYKGGAAYADPDAMDLSSFYQQALDEIEGSDRGRDVLLPLVSGDLEPTFIEKDMSHGERFARAQGCNSRQAEAVGLALGAEHLACIQGPPGTGKTRVLALIAQLLTERGERVFMTSHTHMAINNALNKIHERGIPVVKIGRDTQCKGLDDDIACHPSLAAWHDRPANGYVVGATSFATCTARLDKVEFDVVLFDEASQVTVPLALMAMRTAKRFVFIGDQKQLPPVLLSRSILAGDATSVFAALTRSGAAHSVMLDETYRMNRWLASWPSHAYYGGALKASGINRERRLQLQGLSGAFEGVFDPSASGVFIPTLDRSCRTRNRPDAELVVGLCEAAVEGGLPLRHIGIVTPYRAQGRAVRGLLRRRFGSAAAREVVADTVERMQGQERELVILSLVTGDAAFLGLVAPFFFQPERLNVSITRAKSKLIVIGPEPASVPDIDDGTLRGWTRQYREFIGQLQRVEL